MTYPIFAYLLYLIKETPSQDKNIAFSIYIKNLMILSIKLTYTIIA
jgi:hypothetical protein